MLPHPIDPPRPARSVFLSYASEDRQAARAIRDALAGLGLEVWYDESELNGGDAWDHKIRRQIRECDFFMPLISARTEARHEGYFRREWRLAVERTLDMADDHVFLLPIVIDDTGEIGACVPEKFLTVQWMRLPGGTPTSAFETLCRRLASDHTVVLPKRSLDDAARARSAPARRAFSRFPKSLRILFYIAIAGVLVLASQWVVRLRATASAPGQSIAVLPLVN